ncbi:MAG: hypothetical protein HN348_18860 [Proteobacteria bacterium]|jgi:hypothetical protein|nr:hypothetical protein [Pseudomonadota bacterium]
MLYTLILLLTPIVAKGGEGDLCKDGEKAVFACQMEKSTKLVSLCEMAADPTI